MHGLILLQTLEQINNRIDSPAYEPIDELMISTIEQIIEEEVDKIPDFVHFPYEIFVSSSLDPCEIIIDHRRKERGTS